jgi:hypothetical protein
MTPAEMMEDLLAEEDIQHLKDKGHVFEVERATGLICVVIRNFPLPAAYNPQTTDLLLRLPQNFPMACPDMFWTCPHVKLANGAYPTRADVFNEQFQGRVWQRWSRHPDAARWRPGTDNLKTFLGTIRRELQKGI